MRDISILHGLLQEQIRLHHKMLDLVNGQRKQFAGMQLSEMENTARAIKQLTSEIEDIEQHREIEMECWSSALGLDTNISTLRELVARLGALPERKADAALLWKTGEELKSLIDEIKKANRTNRLMISRGIEYLNEEFKSAVQREKEENYTPNGKKGQASSAPRMLNVRA